VNMSYPTLPIDARKMLVRPVILFYPVPIIVDKRSLEELKKDFRRKLGSGKGTLTLPLWSR